MTTSTFTSPFDCDTDAHFRAWGSQISAQLAAVGLTQTADTGQIDWTTASIAGYPGAVGYEVWAFNDSFQSTTPIVFRLEYGANSAENPYMAITAGGASDGAGNITGTLKTEHIQQNVSGPNYLQAYPSYICYKPSTGFLGVALKIGAASGTYGGQGFCFTRTNDTSGAATGDGWNLYCTSTRAGSYSGFYFQNPGQGIALPSNQQLTENPNYVAWPQGLSSSYANGSLQAMPLWALQPAIQTNAQLCAYINSELPPGNQFSLNAVGLTARNFITVGSAWGQPVTGVSTYGFAMIWE